MAFSSRMPNLIQEIGRKEKKEKKKLVAPPPEKLDDEEIVTGYIYIVKDKATGAYNVGYHSSPDLKMKELQRGTIDLILLGQFRVPEKSEAEHLAHDNCLRRMKPRLKKGNRGRNWFENPEQVDDSVIIDSVKSAISHLIL